MHPLILQQLAADRVNDMIATAADSRRAREARRARRARTSGRRTQPGLPGHPARVPACSFAYPGYGLTIPGRRGRADRPGCGPGAAQLVQHPRDVALDPGFGQVQPRRDLRVGQALTEAGQHLGLAVGERPGQVPGAVAGPVVPIGGGYDERRAAAGAAATQPPGSPPGSGNCCPWSPPGTPTPRSPAAWAYPREPCAPTWKTSTACCRPLQPDRRRHPRLRRPDRLIATRSQARPRTHRTWPSS